jgi:hypothetical protein
MTEYRVLRWRDRKRPPAKTIMLGAKKKNRDNSRNIATIGNEW